MVLRLGGMTTSLVLVWVADEARQESKVFIGKRQLRGKLF